MKPTEILGVLVGAFGIAVLDLGFTGAAITDLFYIPISIKNAVPVSQNIGANLLGNTISLANNTLFFIGGGFLGVGMIILILHNRNLGKPSISGVPPK